MSKKANFFLKIAETLKNRSSKHANKFLRIAQNTAAKDGAKMKIILPKGDGPIQYKYEKTTGDQKTAWDNFYGNAGLFIQQRSQEIEVNLNTDDVKQVGMQLTDKAKLEPVFNANVAKNLWGFAQGTGTQQQLNYIIIAGIGLVVFMMMM